MFELSLIELLLIGIVGLLVIGPEDLPKLFRSLMQLFQQIRAAIADITSEMDKAMDESGVKTLKSELKDGAKYIIDQNGDYQEIFDISELDDIDSSKKNNKKKQADDDGG